MEEDEKVTQQLGGEPDAPEQTAEPDKVVCPKCGAENDATVAYRPKCGAKLEGAAAYDLAPDDDAKTDILFTNIIAKQCADVADGLKDPDSFKLRGAYVDRSTGQFALGVSGANSYGTTVSNYYLFSVNNSKNGYAEYYVSDLEEETYYRFDTSPELTEKLINNATRSIISDLMRKSSNKLDNGYIDAINTLFENDALDSVTSLDNVSNIYNLKSQAKV